MSSIVTQIGQPIDVAKAFHTHVQSVSSNLQVSKSTLNGKVSSHIVTERTGFSTLFSFQKLALGERCGDKSFVGTIAGELVLSVNAAYTRPEPPHSKKRGIDTTTEDATRAIAKIRKSGKDADSISEESYEVAKQTISDILKIKGASGENALESWALSLRKPGDYGATPVKDGRLSLMIAARVVAGVAISIASVCNAVKVCNDGMITVSSDSVVGDFNLPMTEQCKEAHERGQRSIIILASVPHVDDTTSREDDNKGKVER
tara:strand:+ start:1580 stop:2362 length:783 start_codon:yes stop_codon:yes gene_type:complete